LNRVLAVIPEPTPGIYSVRIRLSECLICATDAGDNLACGVCGAVLASGVDPADFNDVAFRCACEAWGALVVKPDKSTARR
jgi:hypothetical protein